MKVKQLMEEIANFDCNPSVFDVKLSKPQYLDCFVISVEFRNPKDSQGSTSQFTVRHEDPVTGLEIALIELKDKYGRCVHCGNYFNHAK